MELKQSFLKTLNGFKQMTPILIGVLLLVSLSLKAIPKSFYTNVFTGNNLLDPLLGAVVGSVAAGNPVTSYIIGGEFLEQGISLLAITAFILAWVSVGVIQLPAESLMLGRKFALVRNGISFLTALVVSILTVLTLTLV